MKSNRGEWITYIIICILLVTTFQLNLVFPSSVSAGGVEGFGRSKSSSSTEPYGADTRMPFSKEPVNLATGRYLYQHQDLFISGRGLPLTITRTYNSGDNYDGPFGIGWTFNYNINLTLNLSEFAIEVMNQDGRRDMYKFLQDPDLNRIYGISDKLNLHDMTYSIDRKNGTSYVIDTKGRLNAIVDGNDNAITFTYADNNNLSQIVDASKRILAVTNDNNGRIIRIQDWSGRTWNYDYDLQGNLIQYTDPMGNQTKYNYDKDHQMTSITDALGNQVMANEYNLQGRVITQADASGAVTRFEYDISNKQTTEIGPLGRKTVYTYNEHWYETSKLDALGNTTTDTYDKNGNINSITDANGYSTRYEYDDRGNITQIMDALGDITKITYNTRDNLTSITDSLGNQTALEYDNNSNLTRVVNATGSTTAYAYDQNGQRIEMVNPNASITKYTCDSNGNLKTRTDPLGNDTVYTYDAIGRVIKETDANGNATAYTYNELGQLSTVTDALGGMVTYTYDAVGNMTAMNDANGHITKYTYDAFNHLKSVTDPLGNNTNYSYDGMGNRISSSDAAGKSTRYSYDALNRLSQIDYADNTMVKYTYDLVGNRLSMTDSHGTTKYGYDSLNRLTRVTNSGNDTITYKYDALGNRTGLVYPDGKAVSYQYDAANRLIQVTDQENRSTNYRYDLNGNLLRADYPNGTRTEFGYDKSNGLVRLVNSNNQKLISSFDYILDHVGNRVKVTEQFGAEVTGPSSVAENLEPVMKKALESSASKLTGTDHLNISYEYDKLYRLISVSYPFDVTVDYGYDLMGNRTSMTTARGSDKDTVNYVYDSTDHLLKAGDVDYQYDLNGNLIGKKANEVELASYMYDATDRLIKAGVISGQIQAGFLDKMLALFSGPSPRISVNYEYDGDGNRIKQTVTSGNKTGVTEYIWDISRWLPQVLTETDGSNNNTYLRGIDLISVVSMQDDPIYFYFDGLGSVRNIADSRGNTKAGYFYGVFGQRYLTMGTNESSFGFTGEQMDVETGLVYLRARYYDPSVGRFIMRDSLGGFSYGIQSLNRYCYVKNNVTNWVDPMGLCGLRGFGNELMDVGISIGKNIASNALGAAIRGVVNVYPQNGDLSLIPSMMKGGIEGRLGGEGIMTAVEGGLASYTTNEVITAIFSNGGKTEVRNVAVLSDLGLVPGAGPILGIVSDVFFTAVPVCE